MPLYFFHLTFGDRVALDEEGVELPNRSAACAEARAVVRDLSDPTTGGNPRRWASWFLLVADSRGAFLRAGLGHPALQVVSKDPGGPGLRVGSHLPLAGTTAAMAEEHAALRHRTVQLLERNRQLRSELSAGFQECAQSRSRALQLVSSARLVEGHRGAAKPARRSPPELVLLPGGLRIGHARHPLD
jgi:hypothetical protein